MVSVSVLASAVSSMPSPAFIFNVSVEDSATKLTGVSPTAIVAKELVRVTSPSPKSAIF